MTRSSLLRSSIAALALASLALLGLAAPAYAHDKPSSSSPAQDEELSVAPTEVSITFTNDLLSTADSGTAMTVVDESGQDWVGGEPEVVADTLTVPLKEGMSNGAYVVTWQVVSSDGHPTDGEYTFTVAAPETTPTPTPSPTATQETPTTQPTPAQTGDDASDANTAESAPWPLLIGLGVVLLFAIGIVIYIAVRNKRDGRSASGRSDDTV